ncbi:protein of unknown function [Paraburkholderia dioscoreae]|uniref:Uncharacterized protein n=1 Tax=Paraburkholderia dioscoreae TaxID=2604047 RepID=A0A5Q4YXE3_9BURK|nr:protein of unknown function [Paraburkholderia dioscoreae]
MPGCIGRRAVFPHTSGASRAYMALRACIGCANKTNDCESRDAHWMGHNTIIF